MIEDRGLYSNYYGAKNWDFQKICLELPKSEGWKSGLPTFFT